MTDQTSAPCGGHRQQLFLDCDGVLADFDAAFAAQFGHPPRVYEAQKGSNTFWRDIQHEAKDFYRNLPLMADARVLYDAVAHLRPIILTGCPLGGWAEPQKLAWAAEHFPGVPMITCMSKDKRTYCRPGDILVDDYLKYRDLWEGAGGIFIHHTSAASSLAALAALTTQPVPAVAVTDAMVEAAAAKFMSHQHGVDILDYPPGMYRNGIMHSFREALNAALTPAAQAVLVAVVSDAMVEAAAKAMHDGPLGADDEAEYTTDKSNRSAEWCRDMARAALSAALSAPAQPVPGDMMLVPREPTEAMAVLKAVNDDILKFHDATGRGEDVLSEETHDRLIAILTAEVSK
ncbi:MAG: hypothetical protein E5W09_22585 [Mesorhizobium sp.]|nr:MAG: hypothetical protein E5W09_22585 [Mesorhizobium sp.]